MKKGIVIVITVILLVATVFLVINYKKYEIINEGVISRPVSKVATWNAAKGLYMSIDGDFGYKKCTCPPSDRCPDYPPEREGAYHKYFPLGPNGEYMIEVDYEFFYFTEHEGSLYIDIADLSRYEVVFKRWELHELTDKPKLPEFEPLEEYTNGADNILQEAAGFFRWFGNAFLYLFKFVGYFWENLVYYFEYVTIFFKAVTM